MKKFKSNGATFNLLEEADISNKINNLLDTKIQNGEWQTINFSKPLSQYLLLVTQYANEEPSGNAFIFLVTTGTKSMSINQIWSLYQEDYRTKINLVTNNNTSLGIQAINGNYIICKCIG